MQTFFEQNQFFKGTIGLGEMLFLEKACKLTKPEQLNATFAI